MTCAGRRAHQGEQNDSTATPGDVALCGRGSPRAARSRRGGSLAAGPRPGDPAPPYAAVRLDGGDTVALASLRGDVVLLNFWASWCKPCLAEIPALQALERVYADSGLRIVAVSIDKDR